ncbi:hypothetical protein GCK32_019653, partial [Trichostrongylus colubriformis]
RIREEYERKLADMRNEFRKLQMVEREHKRMQARQERERQELQRYQAELKELKRVKVRLPIPFLFSRIRLSRNPRLTVCPASTVPVWKG